VKSAYRNVAFCPVPDSVRCRSYSSPEPRSILFASDNCCEDRSQLDFSFAISARKFRPIPKCIRPHYKSLTASANTIPTRKSMRCFSWRWCSGRDRQISKTFSGQTKDLRWHGLRRNLSRLHPDSTMAECIREPFHRCSCFSFAPLILVRLPPAI